MFEKLIEDIRSLIIKEDIKNIIEERVREFIENRYGDNERWFMELTYCILVANTSAKSGLKCIEELKKDRTLFDGSAEEIEHVLRKAGYRYPRKRSEYISESREIIKKIRYHVENAKDSEYRRMWLIKNVKGLGMKESSHFLRNIGYFNYAIIDRHIIKILKRYEIIDLNIGKLNAKKYLEIEEILKSLAAKIDLEPGILDLYLWYMDTGEILK
ncbi:MAG: N-glycosylase/DNA lyase [Candidatus Methanomethylicia archaeon]